MKAPFEPIPSFFATTSAGLIIIVSLDDYEALVKAAPSHAEAPKKLTDISALAPGAALITPLPETDVGIGVAQYDATNENVSLALKAAFPGMCRPGENTGSGIFTLAGGVLHPEMGHGLLKIGRLCVPSVQN